MLKITIYPKDTLLNRTINIIFRGIKENELILKKRRKRRSLRINPKKRGLRTHR